MKQRNICANSFGSSQKNVTVPWHSLQNHKFSCMHCHFSVYYRQRLFLLYHSIVLPHICLLHVLSCNVNFNNITVKVDWTNWSRTLYLCLLQENFPACGLMASTDSLPSLLWTAVKAPRARMKLQTILVLFKKTGNKQTNQPQKTPQSYWVFSWFKSNKLSRMI